MVIFLKRIFYWVFTKLDWKSAQVLIEIIKYIVRTTKTKKDDKLLKAIAKKLHLAGIACNSKQIKDVALFISNSKSDVLKDLFVEFDNRRGFTLSNGDLFLLYNPMDGSVSVKKRVKV